MAQFDVYTNPNLESQQRIPYLLDIQADLLDNLSTRVLVPLYHQGNIIRLLQHLNPTVHVNDSPFIASVAELSAVSVHVLSNPVDNISHEHERIIAAIDLLMTGV